MQSGELGLVEKEDFLYSIPSLQTVSANLGPALLGPFGLSVWADLSSLDMTLCLLFLPLPLLGL